MILKIVLFVINLKLVNYEKIRNPKKGKIKMQIKKSLIKNLANLFDI